MASYDCSLIIMNTDNGVMTMEPNAMNSIGLICWEHGKQINFGQKTMILVVVNKAPCLCNTGIISFKDYQGLPLAVDYIRVSRDPPAWLHG